MSDLLVYKKIDDLIRAIRGCTSKNDINKTFERFNEDNLEKRYDILLEAMYNPEMFFSSGEPPIEQKYEFAIEMFLTMEWKLSESLQMMGW